jgi:hypothetical protein
LATPFLTVSFLTLPSGCNFLWKIMEILLEN